MIDTRCQDLQTERLAAVAQAIDDGVVVVSRQLDVLHMNPAALSMFGYADVAPPAHLRELVPGELGERHDRMVAEFLGSGDAARPMQARATVRGRRRNGELFAAEVSIAKIRVRGDTELVAVVRELTQRVELLDSLSRAAARDHLTGLANRREAERVLVHEMSRARRFGHPLAVAMFDLDHFKRVNDQHGHAVGDAVLCEIARRVGALLRDIDTLGRWGGEEFLAVLPETDLAGGIAWSERAREAIAETPVDGGGGCRAAVTASFGVTTFDPALDETLASLVLRADRQMYRAKAGGRNRTEGAIG